MFELSYGGLVAVVVVSVGMGMVIFMGCTSLVDKLAARRKREPNQ